ncbi:MAG: hypothetical protein HC896_16020 [Bacteroidales bacterium]|nr:hypothetical protein [Bacteroidales bacterium]
MTTSNNSNIIAKVSIALILSCATLTVAVCQTLPGNYTSTWAGNSYGQGLSPDRSSGKWVQDLISDAVVGPEGYVYTAAHWDEGGRSAGVYGGKMVGGKEIGNVYGSLSTGSCVGETGKVGKEYTANGNAVAANSNNVYAVFNQNIYKYSLNGCQGSLFIAQNATALDATNEQLLVADGNNIKLFNLASKEKIAEFTVANTGPCAIAPNGDLWVISGLKIGDYHARKNSFWLKASAANPVIKRYSASGTFIEDIVNPSGTDLWWPTDIAFSNNGQLMVADAGYRRQILYFDTVSTNLVNTFGQEGGIAAGTKGVMATDKFYGQMQCGMDKYGNTFVICEGMGGNIRKFDTAMAHVWDLWGLGFVESGDADLYTDGLDIYTSNEHYKMDFSTKELGQEWSHYAYTLDRIAYPNDPRVTSWITSGIIRNLNGTRILFTYGMYGGAMNYFKFDDEIAVHVGSFDPGTWAAMPDDSANIWYIKQNQVWKKPFEGF